LWTREAVRDLVEMRLGIRYSLSMIGQLLRRWGFTPQQPVTRAYERDDEAIKHWFERL
jgi:transposase